MSITIRNCQIAAIAAFFLFAITICIPAPAAGDAPAPVITIPANDTPLAAVAAHGTGVPLSSLQDPGTITLFHIEGPKTEYPGARPIVSGPRYIEFAANPRALLVLAAGAGIAGVVFVLYRKRKPGAETSETTEQSPENGIEKQD
jgi:hypothetical protein